MTKSCVVLHCRAGYKSNNDKCSEFKVPKNSQQYKKWQAAIPGVILKPFQHICEKHFEKKIILREWIKRDHEGRIIAQIPYVYPRLTEAAVPTIFPNTASIIFHDTKSFYNPPKEDTVFDDSARLHTLQQVTIMDCAMSVEQSSPEPVCDTDPVIEHESIRSQMTECNIALPRPSIASPENNESSMDIIPPSTSKPHNDFHVKTVIISDTAQIIIPKSWSVSEFDDEKGHSIVFSHFIMTKHQNIEVPVAN